KASKTILDIGCGTGDHAVVFAKRGYDVTGMDIAEKQVKSAINKADSLGLSNKLEFLQTDMRHFALRDKLFDAAISMFGSINYALTDEDLEKTFSCIQNHLDTGGVFMFEFWNSGGLRPDVNSDTGYRGWEKIEKKDYILVRLTRSKFDPEKCCLSIDFDFIVYAGDKILDTFVETHELRVFSLNEIRSWLLKTGFEVIGLFEPQTFDPPKSNSFRITAVARKTS
ncbi:MAG: class I SAM-dependent methyltransferase, partial [Candidatus Odinarchaeota archaeon]